MARPPRSRKQKLLLAGAANLLLLGVLGLLVEVGGQVWATAHPSWEVAGWEPDPQLGWRLVPGLEFTWAGHHWYARDFSVPVRVNAQGFRDRERTPENPAGALRVALLGDSFLEALQVPLEDTCAQRLERRLGQRHPGAEVLNFASSNWGVGQALLCWEHVAQRYAPRWVAVLVAELHMARTVAPAEGGAFRATAGRSLAIRPVFARRGWALVREPARDLEAFRAAQEALIRDELGGARVRRRARQAFLPGLLRERLQAWLAEPPRASTSSSIDQETWHVNELVLGALARATKQAGARLVVLDACEWFNPGARELSRALAGLCADEGIERLDATAALRAAEARGEATIWAHDGHWTPAGHEAVAAALDELLRSRGL